MTVIAQETSVTYISTGSVGPYAFNFPISTSAALTVTVNGTLLASTAYTVTPVNNNYDNGGSVVLVSAPSAGQTVVLQRSTPLTQTSVFTDNMPTPMQTFENALDKLTEIAQEQEAQIAAGGASGKQYFAAGPGLILTGAGTITSPFTYSLTTGFAISSFSGGQAGELGQSFTNPSFAATYSSTPTGATITNTDSVDSPYTLSSPYTAATLTGTFSHSTTTTTTFTLTANYGVISPTATQTFTWSERIFSGVGTAGATSSVTASGSTAVLSNSTVLSSSGLGVESVGQTFGPFTPSGTAIYLLLNGSSHTFTDALSGFPMSFKSPITVTFVNQYGVSLTMYLYQTTNSLTGTFQPKVAS